MPAHNEWLTLLIATCLWLTLVVGFTSWWRAEACLVASPPPLVHWRRGPNRRLCSASFVAVEWLRTEGGLDDYSTAFGPSRM